MQCSHRRMSFPPRSQAVHQRALRSPASIPSVTSVRCSPRRMSFPPRSQAVHQRAFRSPASIPLCDLCDLCAMLSPMRVFLAQKPSCPSKSLPQSNLNPPFVTSVTSVRCSSPMRVFLAQKPSCPPEAFRFPTSTPSVTSLLL